LLYVVGALSTVVFTYEASAHGSSTSLGVLLAVGFFARATYAFLANPHSRFALTIPLFFALPCPPAKVCS
jgi:hypothetical protein